MAVDVTRMIASVGASIAGSGTVSTRTSRLPWKVSAFTRSGYPARPLLNARRRRAQAAGGLTELTTEAAERRLRFVHQPVDDLRGRRDVAHEPGRLARERQAVVPAARAHVRHEGAADARRVDRLGVRLKLIDQRRSQRPRRGRSPRRQFERERWHHALAARDLHGVSGVGRHDALLPGRSIAISVLAKKRVPSSTPSAPSASAAAMPAAVGDAAGGQYRDVTRDVDHLRHQHHRRDPARVAPRLPALRHEHVGTQLERELGGVPVAHLLHP